MSEHVCNGTPLARCDLCRDDPHGCHYGFRATSPMPDTGVEDSELFLARTTIYALMDKLENGVRVIEFAVIGGKRVMVGASKCRYFRGRLNQHTSQRGGYRPKTKKAGRSQASIRPTTPAAVPPPSSLVPPPPPASPKAPTRRAVPPPPPEAPIAPAGGLAVPPPPSPAKTL